MSNERESTLVLRRVIGDRFKIPAHRVRPADFKILMSYFEMADLVDLTEEEMDAFINEGKANGTFFSRG